MHESLSGTIERVTFFNPENGFAVLRVQVQGKKDLVTVVGKLAQAVAGEYLEASGRWKEDVEHGLQFEAHELRTAAPSTLEGIEKYLGSGLIKGIGPHYARRIVEVFKERTLQIIDESPAFLREIKGIGPGRIQTIRESWRQHRAVHNIIVFLQSHGVGTARAVRIYKTYGERAIEMVRANPYRLANDIWGIGFHTADELAGKLGIERHSPLRARAALRYALQEATYQGHCACPQNELLAETCKLTDVPRELAGEALDFLVDQRELVRDAHAEPEPWIYLPYLFEAERGVTRALHRLGQGAPPLVAVDVDKALAWTQQRMNLALAPAQADAIRQALTQKLLVITGGPGVGKTTIVRGIVDIFLAKQFTVELAAPTGRAAKRLGEATGRPAQTLHRLLEFAGGRGKPRKDPDHPLALDLLIVDEVSMVDLPLMHHLVQALPQHAALVLVGDVNQLPSVGPGAVLQDLIASATIPVVRLTEIFRQAEASAIVRAAHSVLAGAVPVSATPQQPGDFYIVEADSPSAILDRIAAMIRERIPARFGLDPVSDVQVLTPMNRAELGTRNLNLQLQEVLNPPQDGPEVDRFGWKFRVGDKVLQTINNYDKDVFNGDLGRVRFIDDDEQELKVDFDGRTVAYDFSELDELTLAYALTIHKSQGSEYPAVLLPLHTQHYVMLQRNLLYTALTRGKKLVVLIGPRQALELALARQDTARRYTALARRLQEQNRA